MQIDSIAPFLYMPIANCRQWNNKEILLTWTASSSIDQDALRVRRSLRKVPCYVVKPSLRERMPLVRLRNTNTRYIPIYLNESESGTLLYRK